MSIVFLFLALGEMLLHGVIAKSTFQTYQLMDSGQKLIVTLDATNDLLLSILFMLAAIYFKKRE